MTWLALLIASTVSAPAHPRSLWVWGTAGIRNTPAIQAKFFADLQTPRGESSNPISTIFFDGMSPNDLASPATVARLQAFIVEAHRKGVRVDYLCGDAAWALPGNHQSGLNYLKAALAYNRTSTASARFDGFQWDVEPYLNKSWPAQSLRDSYVLFLQESRAIVAQSHDPLKLGAAIPRWFDALEYNGLYKQVIDALDYVALMDYVDSTDRLIADAQTEIDYASKLGKKVWIGVETQRLDDEPTATFYALGNAAMEKAMTAAERHFATSPGFAGIAIHHYDSYLALKP